MNYIEDLKQRQENLGVLYSPAGNEIYTPLFLVREVLDKLPKDVWKIPTYKWLNPACKNGIWLGEIIVRLFDGLKDWEPNEEKRYNHIINDMVYGYAYSDIGLIVTRKTIYGNKNVVGNVQLVEFWKEEINMEFDVIVGNPPYQAPHGNVSNFLWYKFIEVGYNVLNNDGYLVFVHPSAWRKPLEKKSNLNKIQDILFNGNMIYLETHNYMDGYKTFGVGTRYDWYVYQKSTFVGNMIFKNELGKIENINIKNVSFIPNWNSQELKNILSSEEDEKLKLVYTYAYSTDNRMDNVKYKKDKIYRYPVINTTPKKGIQFVYSKRNDKGGFGEKKVIFGDSGTYSCIYDKEGKYGTTQHSYYICVENDHEGESIVKALKSNKFQEFLKSVMWSNYQIDFRMFKYFKKDFWKEFI
jgi:hypothetical protein